ncbi:Uncharacterised protein [Vibrio cholerae]|nr:Uncharacterised protein [Vibrio cholerae]
MLKTRQQFRHNHHHLEIQCTNSEHTGIVHWVKLVIYQHVSNGIERSLQFTAEALTFCG